MTYDQQLIFKQNSDSGDNDDASIQPLLTEPATPENADRPLQHLRRRTERVRAAVETLLYLADYDRAFALRSNAKFALADSGGNYTLSMVSGTEDDLWVYPALTPGRQSGGRNKGGRVYVGGLPYSGVLLTNDLAFTLHSDYTGQRGYADGSTFDGGGGNPALTLGANGVTLTLAANSGAPTGTISATITGSPKRKVTITYGTSGGSTSIDQIIAWVNNPSNLFTGLDYGPSVFFRASRDPATPGSAAPTPFADAGVLGAYDAEAHQVTVAQLVAFFAVSDNRLKEGEGLAVAYVPGPVESGSPIPRGGRRQSLWDLPTDRAGTKTQNTTPSVGYSLFNTGREPEKIPGAIPIGKVIDGEFVFIDGTRIAPGETLALGESRTTYAALRSITSGADGASLVGYEGGAPWSADTTPPSTPTLPADDVSDTLTRIATHLTSTTTGQGGSRRVGGEAQTGSPSLGNDYFLSLTAGSVREQIVQLLQGVDGGSRVVGLNGRVSEYGHQMQGAKPLRKNFGAVGMPASGAEFLRAQLHAPTNLIATSPGAVREKAFMVLCPLVYNVSGTDNMTASETATVTSATVLRVNSMTLTRFGNVMARLPVVLDLLAGASVPLLYVDVRGASGAADAPPGLYVVHSVNVGAGTITVKKMDGTDPDFTGSGSIDLTFFSVFEIGSDHRATLLRWSHVGADAAFYDPAGNPAAVIGASSVDAPLIKVFTPNTGTNAGSLQFVMWANRMEWAGGRKSSNILLDADKNLLDGLEDHLTVDATTSHHHGDNYTRVVFYASTSLVVQDSNTDIGGYTLNAIAGRACASPPANTTRVGVILDVTLKARAGAAVAAGNVVTLRVGFWSNAAGTGAPHATVEVSVQMQAAPSVTTLHTSRVQVMVPTEQVTGTDYFYFAVTNRTPSTLDGSANAQLISITEVGGLFAQANAVV